MRESSIKPGMMVRVGECGPKAMVGKVLTVKELRSEFNGGTGWAPWVYFEQMSDLRIHPSHLERVDESDPYRPKSKNYFEVYGYIVIEDEQTYLDNLNEDGQFQTGPTTMYHINKPDGLKFPACFGCNYHGEEWNHVDFRVVLKCLVDRKISIDRLCSKMAKLFG